MFPAQIVEHEALENRDDDIARNFWRVPPLPIVLSNQTPVSWLLLISPALLCLTRSLRFQRRSILPKLPEAFRTALQMWRRVCGTARRRRRKHSRKACLSALSLMEALGRGAES